MRVKKDPIASKILEEMCNSKMQWRAQRIQEISLSLKGKKDLLVGLIPSRKTQTYEPSKKFFDLRRKYDFRKKILDSKAQ